MRKVSRSMTFSLISVNKKVIVNIPDESVYIILMQHDLLRFSRSKFNKLLPNKSFRLLT